MTSIPSQTRIPQAQASSLMRRAIAIAGGLVFVLAAHAQAVSMGDQFTFVADETNPVNVPGIATAVVTLGGDLGGGLFSVGPASS